jgi:hypothetical protein
MPTGYTNAVRERDNMPFREFALKCARAMGACIMQREEDMDSPPREVVASTYHADETLKTRAEIARLEAMTPGEIEGAALAADDRYAKLYAEMSSERKVTQKRYEAMLEQVEAWKAPSPDHEGFKKFMREQLTESISFDCGDLHMDKPKRTPPGEWYKTELARERGNLDYHMQKQAEEVARTADRNKWIRELYASLAAKPRG